jgi:hypothetical protein
LDTRNQVGLAQGKIRSQLCKRPGADGETILQTIQNAAVDVIQLSRRMQWWGVSISHDEPV